VVGGTYFNGQVKAEGREERPGPAQSPGQADRHRRIVGRVGNRRLQRPQRQIDAEGRRDAVGHYLGRQAPYPERRGYIYHHDRDGRPG